MSAAKRRRDANARQASQRKSSRLKMVFLATAAALSAVVLLVVVGGVLRKGGNSVQHTAEASGFVLGSADAPVLITAWEDFQCPICKAANSSVLKQLEQDYVNTGKVRVQYQQFPFLGSESVLAAEASQCAADQGKFWDYHDALFTAQGAENSGVFTTKSLEKMAATAGIDATTFNSCLESGAHKDSVQAEKKAGEALGVNATPTFFVNGKKVADWRDYASFKLLIEQALVAAGQA